MNEKKDSKETESDHANPWVFCVFGFGRVHSAPVPIQTTVLTWWHTSVSLPLCLWDSTKFNENMAERCPGVLCTFWYNFCQKIFRPSTRKWTADSSDFWAAIISCQQPCWIFVQHVQLLLHDLLSWNMLVCFQQSWLHVPSCLCTCYSITAGFLDS